MLVACIFCANIIILAAAKEPCSHKLLGGNDVGNGIITTGCAPQMKNRAD